MTRDLPGTADQPLHTLVVDDDDVDRERVRRFLVRSELLVEVTEAASGAEALRLVRSRIFDCVVLDNDLGDTDGAALMPLLRGQAQRDFPIVFVTGAGNEALAVHLLLEGASDYLVKSAMSPEGLVRAIQRSVENHRLREENDTLHRQLERRIEDQAAELRQRERDLYALVDHSPVAMGYWDARRTCRFGNRAHGEWFGVSPDRLPGHALQDLLGPALTPQFDAAVADALAGRRRDFEVHLPPMRGQPARDVQAQLLPDADEHGTVVGLYLSMTDVGPQKAVQAKVEELLTFSDAVIERSPIGIAVFGEDGRCVIANAAFCLLAGRSLTALREEDFRQRDDWRSGGLVYAALLTLKDARPRRLDVTLAAASGDVAQWDCALARVDRGGVPQLLLIARDVGEQRRAHEALVRARDAAQSAARTKSSFLANMSHEIRTPMNAIVGLSRIALDFELPLAVRGYIDKLHQSATSLMALLDDVLDYSKIEAGALRMDDVVFDLPDVLRRVVDLFEARAQQKDLRLELHLLDGVPPLVHGDPLRLSQVLNNLVGNALKFTERGHVHVGVGLQPDARLRFAVTDTGIGIAPAHAAQLFGAFVQADESITRRFGGTGLGLAICRQLVQRMGGEIGVDSEPGRGSTFWFTALLRPAEAGEAPAPTAARAGLASHADASAGTDPRDADAELRTRAAGLRGRAVLLVEDNPLNQIVATEYLRRVGIEPETVGDGQAAVDAIARSAPGRYALVLMDLHMPLLDGLEATRRIRRLPAGAALPIIGMTAAAMPEDRDRCVAAGMSDHLAKPVLPEQLVDMLLRWLPTQTPGPGEPEPAWLAPFDSRPLRGLMRHKPELVGRLLRTFADRERETPERLEQLQAARERLRLRELAHDLRGSAGTIGAAATQAAADVLQEALQRGADTAEAVAALQRALRADLAAIERELAGPG